MAENSNIEWTDHTFNPWIGCTKVSDGCKNCYAETLMDKRYGKVKWGPQGVRIRTSAANWKKPLAWNRQAEKEGRRYRVFCASLADVFENKPDQPEMDEWRVDLFELIAHTPYLDWLLLTKHPSRAAEWFDLLYNDGDWVGNRFSPDFCEVAYAGDSIPLPNVWIGTSVENQEQADKRIPELLEIPAAVRFLSVEPLLGPVDLQDIPDGESFIDCLASNKATVDWVIVGGESGANARPMHPDWARAIRDQCQNAGVPFFFKQWGEWSPIKDMSYDKYRDESKFSLDGIYRYGRKAAGRLLDGREWNEFPEVQRA